jgi:hypothetical protein
MVLSSYSTNGEWVMIYKVLLEKQHCWWWDEDVYGRGVFCAQSDEEARLFISLIVQRMNRKYLRMGEPRNIIVNYIRCLQETENGIVERDVELHTISIPLKGFREIRKALEIFFPKNKNGKRFCSIVNDFFHFAPISRK